MAGDECKRRAPAWRKRNGAALPAMTIRFRRRLQPFYTAAKSAMLGLTRSLARDYGSFNIRVNAIAPGWIMTQRQMEKWLTPEGEVELMQRQCLKRKLQPDEIARFTVFLASEEASACTNQQYVVDGGWV